MHRYSILAAAGLFFTFIQGATAQGLPIIGHDPIFGPICAGPLGPGPCAQVQHWMMMNAIPGSAPVYQTPGTIRSSRARLGHASGDPFAPSLPSIRAETVRGAIQCAQRTGQDSEVDIDAFLGCTRGALVLDQTSMTLVNCAEQTDGDMSDFSACAGSGILAKEISPRQRRVIECAAGNPDDEDAFADCIVSGLAADRLTPQHRAVLDCAVENGVDTTDFAACVGMSLLGRRLSPTGQAAIECASQSQGDVTGFATCAGVKFLEVDLNPEQQIALQCVASTGGQPYGAASCMAARLTARELTKCAINGFGGPDGCFGDNNDLVGRNGFLVRNVEKLAGGPNSFIRDPLQITGGNNSVVNNPRQILGGPNSEPNRIIRQIPSPPPIEVGKVGNHRICIPWC